MVIYSRKSVTRAYCTDTIVPAAAISFLLDMRNIFFFKLSLYFFDGTSIYRVSTKLVSDVLLIFFLFFPPFSIYFLRRLLGKLIVKIHFLG